MSLTPWRNTTITIVLSWSPRFPKSRHLSSCYPPRPLQKTRLFRQPRSYSILKIQMSHPPEHHPLLSFHRHHRRSIDCNPTRVVDRIDAIQRWMRFTWHLLVSFRWWNDDSPCVNPIKGALPPTMTTRECHCWHHKFHREASSFVMWGYWWQRDSCHHRRCCCESGGIG